MVLQDLNASIGKEESWKYWLQVSPRNHVLTQNNLAKHPFIEDVHCHRKVVNTICYQKNHGNAPLPQDAHRNTPLLLRTSGHPPYTRGTWKRFTVLRETRKPYIHSHASWKHCRHWVSLEILQTEKL